MKKESTNQYLNTANAIVERSYQIKSHLDYFVWLQNSVAELIPHDMLLAVWGDFKQQQDGRLHYDAASNVKGLTTSVINAATDRMNHIFTDLYELSTSLGSCFVVNMLEEAEMCRKVKSIFPEQLVEINALLVYSVKDERSGEECLYVFFSKEHALDMKKHMMDFIMPHVDHTLRKIKPLSQVKGVVQADDILSLATLSDREIEVISWIKAGKTNQEIGMILNISQNTVKSHLKRIFQKLNIGRRAQAVALLANIPSIKVKQTPLSPPVRSAYN